MKTIAKFGLPLLFTLALLSFSQDKEPWNVPDEYKKMTNPYADDLDDLLDYGADLYDKHCASCHGDDGIGDGSKADELKTYPGDFTSDEFKALSDGEIYYMSIIGRDEMPNYEKKIPDEEDRWAVIEYVKSL
jgi:mono/diheme cytochrome c family protein